MKYSLFKSCASVAALAISLGAGAYAQDADVEESADGLDVIVVTASGRDQTQIESSISVTSVDSALIENFQPSSEAEVFKLLPGIQVPGTSGPGGNSNIAVRGLPVATGGAPFVQLQEDGLPLVLFGDIQFGNNDYWTRFDPSVANVEAVRGGSATTFASQAPGAVINYISNYGEREGGYVELRKGLTYNETQANFRYGGDLSESMRFHVGGLFKRGRGPLGAGYNVSDSVQVKANITKDFAGGDGYFRLLFKFADTQEPNYTGAPALATINGNAVTSVGPFPNFDGRSQSNYSIYNQDFLIYNREGDLERVEMSGITTKQKYIGGQFHYEFSDQFTVDNNMRWADISGAFSSPFLGLAPTSSVLGSTVNGQTVAAIRYASSQNAGLAYTEQFVDNNVNVRTNIRDLGSFVNDLTLAGKFETGFADVTARVGYFYMDQTIAMDWHVNKSLRAVDGGDPSQLDLFNAAGNQITYEGISGYNNNWGNCCARDYDLSYTNTAPYAQLVIDNDAFNLDGSVRFEKVKAAGYTIAGGAEFLINPNPTDPNQLPIPTITSNGTRETLDYSRSYTSWTVGGLFKATPDLSLFGRVSKGGRFNSDRQTVSGKFNPDGSLCTRAQADALQCTDGVTPSVDFVNQYEVGVKNRGDLLGGRYTVELTLLKGDFDRSDYEPTVTGICPNGGCVINNSFESKGAEFYATFRSGPLSLIANATYTKAKQRFTSTEGGTVVAGNSSFGRALNIPDLSYSLAADYDTGIASLGVNVVGQSETFDGARTYPGKAVFGMNVGIEPIENLRLGVNAYNLFNTYDARGNGVGVVSAGPPAVITGTPVIGRTITASVRLGF